MTMILALLAYGCERPEIPDNGKDDDKEQVDPTPEPDPEPEPEPEPVPEDAVTLPYKVDFTAGIDKFTVDDRLCPENFEVWIQDASYGMVANAFVSSSLRHETDSWLVSPKISLSGASAPVLNFTHVHKFATAPQDEMTVMDYGSAAKNDYDDYAVSVDSIEEWTGFDFFANLSESLQTTAESNTSVSSFSSFR